MDKQYCFKLKKIDKYDEQLYLSFNEKIAIASILSKGEKDLEGLIHGLWDKNISIVACNINELDCILQIVCDDDSYIFISNVVNSFECQPIQFSFLYDGKLSSFILKFNLKEKEEAINYSNEKLKNNFYEVNDFVSSAYNLFFKISSNNSFELLITSPSNAILKVRNKDEHEKIHETKVLSDCISEIERNLSFKCCDYICDKIILKKLVRILPVIKPLFKYEKDFKNKENENYILTLPLDKQRELAIKYCEGNENLYKLLLLLWENGIFTIGCCGSHYYEDNGNLWNSIGRVYFGILITDEKGLQFASYVISMLNKFKEYDLKCTISGPHPDTYYLDFSFHIPRKYSDELLKELCIFLKKEKNNNSICTELSNSLKILSDNIFSYFTISLYSDKQSKIKLYKDGSNDKQKNNTLLECIQNDTIESGEFFFDKADLDTFLQFSEDKKLSKKWIL